MKQLRKIILIAAFAGLAAIPSTATAVTPAPRHQPTFTLGVDVPTGLYEVAPITAFQALARRPVGIVQNFVDWSYPSDPSFSNFPTVYVDNLVANGDTPEISWDPTISGGTSNQPSINLNSIISGTYDGYIRQFAEAAKGVHHTILLRFAQEMNGTWTNYAESNSGNAPAEFVAAWRHVWAIFQQTGATNVQWVWSPNVVEAGDDSLRGLYPGNTYVNWTAVDGYAYPLAGCESPAQVFGPALAEIRSFSSRPTMLGEVAVDSSCSDPATWITQLFSWIHENPTVKSLTWWQRIDSDGDDWLVNNSPSELAAFRAGLATVMRQQRPCAHYKLGGRAHGSTGQALTVQSRRGSRSRPATDDQPACHASRA